MIKSKRGATIRGVARWQNSVTKVAVDLTGCTIYGQVRDSQRQLVASIDLALLDQATNTGQVSFDFGSTAAWPLGKLYFDFVREVPVDDGVVIVYSKTASIDVSEGVTDHA